MSRPGARNNLRNNLNPGRVGGRVGGRADLNPGRVGGRRGAARLRASLEVRPDAEDVEAVLHHEFWRAPTLSPPRLVWTAQR